MQVMGGLSNMALWLRMPLSSSAQAPSSQEPTAEQSSGHAADKPIAELADGHAENSASASDAGRM